MARSDTPPDLLAKAFELVAEQGWPRFSLTALAAVVELPLAAVYEQLPGRGALLARLGERVDREMLAIDAGELAGLSPRERLFELIMRRLDALTPYRAGLKAFARSGRSDPELLCASLGNLQRLSAWLGDAVALRPGLKGCLGRHAMLLAYGRVFAVWLEDESVDLASTLAELDKRLGQLEQLARWWPGRRSGDGERAEAA